MGHEDFVIDRIREAHSRSGMSVATLARRSLIDESRLRRILRGERRLMADELLRMCVPLRLNPGQLFPRELMARLAELSELSCDRRDDERRGQWC